MPHGWLHLSLPLLVLFFVLPSESLECNLDGGEYVEEYVLVFSIETCHACPLGRFRPPEPPCASLSENKRECSKCAPCPEGWTTKQKASVRQEQCDVEWNATSFMHPRHARSKASLCGFFEVLSSALLATVEALAIHLDSGCVSCLADCPCSLLLCGVLLLPTLWKRLCKVSGRKYKQRGHSWGPRCWPG